MLKKVAIITYYWPPSGGAGVQRWLKFTKYLPENGWQPIVFIPENANYPSIDDSLEKDIPKEAIIYKIPIWEPYDLYRKFLGLDKKKNINHTFNHENKKSKWKQKMSLWLKCNLFIPDPRIFWLFKGVKTIEQIMNDQKIEHLITTSPPNSVQLFGYFLKKRIPNLKWISDLRDPWTNIFFEKDLPYSFISKWINKQIERKTLSYANLLTTVSKKIAQDYQIKFPKLACKVITNGFDASDISENKTTLKNKETLTFSYTGTLFNLYNMPVFWNAISEILKDNPEYLSKIEIEIAGSISPEVLDSFKALDIQSVIKYHGYVNHDKLNEIANRTDVFLLTTPRVNNNGILTGKVFEYLAYLKPILCVTDPLNNLSELIQTTQSGIVIDFDDIIKMKNVLNQIIHDFENQNISKNDFNNISQYSRQNLTHQLSEYLNNI
jgi:glycosyltransferase involved in cell wall biosynthesis